MLCNGPCAPIRNTKNIQKNKQNKNVIIIMRTPTLKIVIKTILISKQLEKKGKRGRDRQTDIEKDRHTDTERKRERQTDRYREIERKRE